MKKLILFLALAAIVIAGCNVSGYKHTKSGLYYKIISKGKSQPLKAGQYFKLNLQYYIHDSLFFDSKEKMPQYGIVDSVGRPYDYSEVLHLMNAEDSLVTIQLVDTIMKTPGIQLPPFFHKGDKLKTCIQLVKVFDTVTLAQVDYGNEMAKFKEKEDAKNAANFDKAKKDLADFIAKNKISATQTPKGVYVAVKQAGSGASADSGLLVGVKYRGTLLDGTLFDTNIGPDRKDTLQYPVSSGAMIPGFDEAVRGQKVGTKMTIYIPTQYGYGAQGRGDVIKPFYNIMFDLEVVSVKEVPKRNTAPIPTEAQ